MCAVRWWPIPAHAHVRTVADCHVRLSCVPSTPQAAYGLLSRHKYYSQQSRTDGYRGADDLDERTVGVQASSDVSATRQSVPGALATPRRHARPGSSATTCYFHISDAASERCGHAVGDNVRSTDGVHFNAACWLPVWSGDHFSTVVRWPDERYKVRYEIYRRELHPAVCWACGGLRLFVQSLSWMCHRCDARYRRRQPLSPLNSKRCSRHSRRRPRLHSAASLCEKLRSRRPRPLSWQHAMPDHYRDRHSASRQSTQLSWRVRTHVRLRPFRWHLWIGRIGGRCSAHSAAGHTGVRNPGNHFGHRLPGRIPPCYSRVSTRWGRGPLRPPGRCRECVVS